MKKKDFLCTIGPVDDEIYFVLHDIQDYKLLLDEALMSSNIIQLKLVDTQKEDYYNNVADVKEYLYEDLDSKITKK